MKYPPHLLDEIRSRLPVSEIVGARVKLKKRGREWVGLSPFNSEKTPSFYVNDQKGFYHDFSSGRHGDIFKFLMETEGASFPETVEKLAAQAGVSLPKATSQEEQEEDQRNALRGALAQAALAFERFLHEPVGAKARGYLADRRIDPATQKLFGVGFAPGEDNALREALIAKGVARDLLLESGLLAQPEDGRAPYDRFRDRVMFPIHDRGGRAIAFGGRAMNPQARAKYLNSPETPLFHKGEVLFNHHRARKAAMDTGEVVVVEGYVDVIMMTQGGFPATVAPLGTALTADQCRLLWSMSDQPTLCFDGDGAGLRAAYRALELALPLIGADKTFKFALLPGGKDPDDIVRQDGPQAMRDLLARAEPLAEMLFRRETEAQVFDTPEKRASLARRLKELVRLIEDENLRGHYFDDMRRRTAALFGTGMAPAGERRPFVPRPRGTWKKDDAPRLGVAGQPMQFSRDLAKAPGESKREIAILAVLINHPVLGEAHYEAISALEFASSRLKHLRDELAHLPPESFINSESLSEAVEKAGLSAVRDAVLTEARKSPLWRRLAPEAEIGGAEDVLRQALTLHRRHGTLHRELRAAQQLFANEPSEQNLARLLDIKAGLDDPADSEASLEAEDGADRDNAVT